LGTTAVKFAATNSSGKAITRFASPLDVRFPGAPGNLIPSLSSDGHAWSALPLLDSPSLPLGFSIGYYRDHLGTLHILTLEPETLGLINASTKLTEVFELGLDVAPKLDIARAPTLALSVIPTRSGVLTVTLDRGTKTLASWHPTAKTPLSALKLRLPKSALRPGTYTVTIEAKNGGGEVKDTKTVAFVSR
jgi:hypothetical protein